MTAADGMVITAIAKEKEKAKREHEAAITQGYMTGLVEHVDDDVFSISLGALPGQQTISTEITYVLDLMDDDILDQVRLQIPMYVGMRYGTLPEGMQGAHQAPPHRINISVDVRMQGTVRNILSPTYPSVILSDSTAVYASRSAHYFSADFLQRDFVLSILADGLDAPRCFAQRAKNGFTAIQLNIVPKFNLQPIPQQEYIFLVDRSGSMGGSRIQTAKKTLVMLLRALPSQGTHINIFSFGSRCDSLWNRSVLYDESALGIATGYVDNMWADYGGTETLKALNQVFKSRRMDTPTACFVLTDGESHDTNRIIEAVDKSVQKARPNASLRVFTLGIGNTTSSAVCEGIARAGNGVCLMATTSESIVGKCSKLVRASRTYILKNVFVDWGVGTDLNRLRAVRQAPAPVSAIYPGNRFIVFALVEDEKFTLPREVVIRAQRDGQGEVLQFRIPVQIVEFPPDHPHPQLIPTLAARRIIMDLDDKSRTQCPPDIKTTVIKLGTEYQLASKFTSFVAVDRRTEEQIMGQIREGVRLGLPRYVPPYDPTIENDSGEEEWDAVIPQSVDYSLLEARGLPRARGAPPPYGATPPVPTVVSAQPAMVTPSSRPGMVAPSFRSARAFASPAEGAPVIIPPVGALGVSPAGFVPDDPLARAIHNTSRAGASMVPAKRNSANLGSSLKNALSGISLRRSSDASSPSSPQRRSSGIFGSLRGGSSSQSAPPPATSHAVRRQQVDPGPTSYNLPPIIMMTRDTEPVASQPLSLHAFSEEYGASPVTSHTAEDMVVGLVRFQSFDGSFPPTAQLEAIVGKNLLSEAEKLEVDPKVWATVLAVAYLKKYMRDQPELLDGLAEKAMEFLSRIQNDTLQTLLARADTLVA
ncbi:uncharacterized protein PHACADRAFT_254902 [Phanerochaete carnosa HHB-10118-sp]|uniref:VWFA domain-containing protein n=1 Tax=Phanerochaete carnosa (strain HHB-10118-sp) TaxID=650164 RepID=K5WD88_PHACS|nr:uncharacterized protein PHACADRAFT_254902 [Phanerochaete carnosa HHB-10118-sp]EKM57240.1 hypothetical protein PHACADRAFT_254902 [Phanerochaete carnosa HHB-10118-sp]